MNTKITVICENSVYLTSALIAEHGLSFLIENEDITLFDTGQGLGLINNLKVLNKNIQSIKRVILSHGHYDHTGGLLDLLRNYNGKMPVYIHSDAFNNRFSQTTEGNKTTLKSIGIRHSRIDYEKEDADFHLIKNTLHITKQISAFSEVKHEAGWKSSDKRLKQKINNKLVDDPFLDDLSLLLLTDSGPVIILGCAHAGVIDILNNISEQSGYREFYAVIGGTHLHNASEEYIKQAIEIFKKFRVKKIALSHCTGYKIEYLFAEQFKDKFHKASVGSVFEF
jgi:7,8-dihydropterin-6-yl-methyl-4-(beta-D-ribofuranosyl)aminobenzene 5'-phosphate synthase